MVPAGCAFRPGEEKRLVPPKPAALTGPGRPGGLPAGVYRFSISRAELIDLGVNDHDATINAGVLTWTLRGGNWTVRHDPAEAGVSAGGICQGWYDVQGDAVTFVTNTKVEGGTCAPPVWTARWSGKITWSAVSILDYAPVFAGKPWQKIG